MTNLAPPPPGILDTSSGQLPALGNQPGITLDRVLFSYDDATIIQNLTWELPEGHSAVITGRSGCGKSTLLYVAAGLLPPARGAVLLAGHPVSGMLPSTRVHRGLRVGFVFQEGGLLANLDCISNVTLALRYHFDVFELDEQGISHRAEEALRVAGVAEADWGRVPAHLSFGNRKRLAMARALAIKPNFFFFDDPDVGLDPRTAQITHHILCMLRDDPEVTLLVATNRPQLIERLGVPGFRLEAGSLETHSGQTSLPPALPRIAF